MLKTKFFHVRLTVYFFLILLLIIFWPTLVRKLIYFPEKTVSENAIQELNFYRFEQLTETFEGDDLRGYIYIHDAPEKIIILFHGNKGLAANRILIARGFLDQKAIIFLPEYPGYGNRSGSASEDNLTKAAVEDVTFLKNQFPELPVYLVGESLGSGVAAKVAGEVPVQGLVLVSPFPNLIEAAKRHYRFLPLKWLIPDHYDSVVALQKSEHPPVLIIHGKEDKIVPYDLGEKLFQTYDGPKEMIALKTFGHNDLPWEDLQGEMWQGIRRFLNSTN